MDSRSNAVCHDENAKLSGGLDNHDPACLKLLSCPLHPHPFPFPTPPHHTSEFIEDPKTVFKEIYRVLRVGGSCHIVFTSKNTYKGYEDKQASFWSDMNDAQHMCVRTGIREAL